MNIVNKTIIYHSRSDVFTLIGLGDCHLGNVGFETRKFLDTIDEIKNNMTEEERWLVDRLTKLLRSWGKVVLEVETSG